MDLNYEFFAHQWDFMDAIFNRRKRVVAFIGGIRSGKTYSGARAAALKVVEGMDGGIGWIISPTYPMSSVPEREFESTGIMEICIKHVRDERLYEFQTTKGKFTVEVKTAEYPDRLRGPGLAWVWIDEAAYISEECWDILQGRVLDTGGTIFITTTPRGKNWLYNRVYVESVTNSDYYCRKARTVDNLRISPEAITSLSKSYTKDFAQQELNAEFISFEGLVYKCFDPVLHVIEPFEIPSDWTIYSGIDFGFNDPFVNLWIAYHDRRYIIIEEYYQNAKPLAYHAGKIRSCPYDRNVSMRFADPSNPQDSCELARYDVPTIPGQRAISTGIQRVFKLLETIRADGAPALQVFNTCKHTIEEFGKYVYVDGGHEKPSENYNHCMDALRYCISSVYTDEESVEIIKAGWDPKLNRNERAIWEMTLPNRRRRNVMEDYE